MYLYGKQLWASIIMVLRYSILFLEENAANIVSLCVLRAHFSPLKCSETIFHLRASLPDSI